MIKRYEFCAPTHHTLDIGGRQYAGGSELELDESVAETVPALQLVEEQPHTPPPTISSSPSPPSPSQWDDEDDKDEDDE